MDEQIERINQEMKDLLFLLAGSNTLHYVLDDICDTSFTNIPAYAWIEILR